MNARACLAGLLLVTAACSAEVRREDDDGSDPDAAAGAGGNASTGTGGGAAPHGTGGAAPYDPAEGCRALCDRDCTGNPTRCQEQCLEAVAADWSPCAEEAVALHACVGEACGFVDPDCAAEERALDRCHNVHSCGAEIYEHTCAPATSESCDCTTGCADGHVARIVCVEVDPDPAWVRDCDCFFDGELVGQCRLEGTSGGCITDNHNCCEDLFVR